MKESVGPQTMAWMTYEGGMKREMQRILPGIPLLMVCSNSGDTELPSSAIIRIGMVSAAVQDGMRGVICWEEDLGQHSLQNARNNASVQQAVQNSLAPMRQNQEDDDTTRNEIIDTNSLDFIDPEKEDNTLRDIAEHTCKKNVLFFATTSMMHTVVKQVLAGIDMKLHCNFSLRADVHSVITNMSSLSGGLMRGVVGGQLNANRDELLCL